MQNLRIKLDCLDTDAPKSIKWWCRNEASPQTFSKAQQGSYLIAYRCDSCRASVHPGTFILSGQIIEGKWSKGYPDIGKLEKKDLCV